MNLFAKLALRRPYMTTLLVLLLCTAIALSGVGYSAWNATRMQQEAIADDYTTIVVPKDLTKEFDPFSQEYSRASQLQSWAIFALRDAPQIKMVDHRAVLSAHIPGSVGLASPRRNGAYYEEESDMEAYALGVLAVRCSALEELPSELGSWYNSESFHTYSADFEIEQIVCANDAYQNLSQPKYAKIIASLYLPDGSAPFQVGGTYLIFGCLSYVSDGISATTAYLTPFPMLDGAGDYNTPQEEALVIGRREGRSYFHPAQTVLPWCAQYTGSVEEFLTGAAGQRWHEEVLPLCRRGYESATLMLTDRMESIYPFHSYTNSLVEGRFFTREEYETGADVCILSADYAQENGLRLGDSLNIELYQGYTVVTSPDDTYLHRFALLEENAIGVQKTYTIVGIYTGPVVQSDTYGFNADTIFAPKASVPHAAEYEHAYAPMLNSYILYNGMDSELEAWLSRQTSQASEGLGGQFLYLDQQYAAMKESLDVLSSNALRVLLVGMLMLGIAGALFLYLSFRAVVPLIRGVRLLGLPAKQVRREVLTVLLTQVALAVALGCIAAAALHDAMTQGLFSATVALDVGAIGMIGAVALALLTVSTLLCTNAAVNRRLL